MTPWRTAWILGVGLAWAVGVARSDPAPRIAVCVHTRDGGRIHGTTELPPTRLETSYGSVLVDLRKARSLSFQEDREEVALVMANGDRLQGVLDFRAITLDTLVGRLVVAAEHVVRIEIGDAGAKSEEARP